MTSSLIYRLLCVVICSAAMSLPWTATADAIPPDEADAATPEDAAFSFVVWGHPRGRNPGESALYVDEVVERIKELGADMLFITGDMIQGRVFNTDAELLRKDWDLFDADLQDLDIPIYRLPGNHDVSDLTSRDVYEERYPIPPYAITFRGSRFIILDSHGIDQHAGDESRNWGYAGLPFDAAQLDFIRNEIANQDNYRHLFFFMHHTWPWAEPDSYWWDDVNPLLKDGRTRAVFSGNTPGEMKYAHEYIDGIHYFLNNTFPPPTYAYVKRYHKLERGAHATSDNLMYVRVEGDKITYRPFIVGAMNTDRSSWRYWENIKSQLPRSQRLEIYLHENLTRLRQYFWLAVIIGSTGLVTGVVLTALWMRRRRRPT